MPRRTRVPVTSMDEALEHLRQGTREQYDSEWTFIEDTGSHSFTHDLGEIPWMVDVMGSETSDGVNPVDRNASVTVVKSTTTITLTNNLGSDAYFLVRAL